MGAVPILQPPPSSQSCLPLPAPARFPHSLEQKPAAGKTNCPILHANGNPAPSRFPSIYFWVSLEGKKKKKSLLPNSWGDGGGEEAAASQLSWPGTQARGQIPQEHPQRQGEVRDPRTPQPRRGCPKRLLCKHPPLQDIPASPTLQSFSMQPCGRGSFPCQGRIRPQEKSLSVLTSSRGFYSGANKRYCCPSKSSLLLHPE